MEPRIVVTQLSLPFGNVVCEARYEFLVGFFLVCLVDFVSGAVVVVLFLKSRAVLQRGLAPPSSKSWPGLLGGEARRRH